MLRYLYLCIILVFISLSLAIAAKSVAGIMPKTILKTDSSVINLRNFDKDALNTYKKQTEFQYKDTAGNPSWWIKFWRWFWNWIAHLFDFLKVKNHSSGFFDTILIIAGYLALFAALATAIFFILKLVGIDVLNIFRGKPAAANITYSETLENIHEINFDGEIEKAISQHNYRLAVRLLYLRSLKQLSDTALITWQPDKTNRAYVNELYGTDRYTTFELLTRQFEYIWYGDFPIDGSVFKHINSMFQKFKNDLS